MTRRNKAVHAATRAFTLIELLVVIIILAILAAVVIPNVVGRTDDARMAKALNDVKAIEDVHGILVGEVRRSRRHFAGACIDWTQRRGHLNGALAAAILGRLFELGWIERGQGKAACRRSVCVTPAGLTGLADTFGVDLP